MIESIRPAAISAGFTEKTYEHETGIFLRKDLLVHNCPYLREHVADGEMVGPEDAVVVEVTPDGLVQTLIPNADYVDGPHPIDSDDGRALLRDAGVALPGRK